MNSAICPICLKVFIKNKPNHVQCRSKECQWKYTYMKRKGKWEDFLVKRNKKAFDPIPDEALKFISSHPTTTQQAVAASSTLGLTRTVDKPRQDLHATLCVRKQRTLPD